MNKFVRTYFGCTIISSWHRLDTRVRVRTCGGHDHQLTWIEFQLKWIKMKLKQTPVKITRWLFTPCSLSQWHVSVYCCKTGNPITVPQTTVKIKKQCLSLLKEKISRYKPKKTLWMFLISWLWTQCATVFHDNRTSTAHKGFVFTRSI